MIIRSLAFLALMVLIGGCSETPAHKEEPSMPQTRLAAPDALTPPTAKIVPAIQTHHGVTLTDPYAWLKDQDYPKVNDADVLAYLEAENAYFDAVMADRKPLTETLFEELKGRVKQDDRSVPAKDGDWLYWWAFEEGAQYRRWYRTPVSGGEEAVILDEPALANGQDYFRLGRLEVSPDGRLAAWSSDTDGSERYTIRVKDLSSGQVLEDQIPDTSGAVLWAEDNRTLLYIERNEQWQPYRVRAHTLGQDPTDDPVLYEEADASFFVDMGKTQSRQFLIIATGDHVTQEVRVIPADAPLSESRLVAERQTGHEYYLDHGDGRFFIHTNDGAKDFRVMTAPEEAPEQANWVELIGPAPGQYIRHIAVFQDFLVVTERIDGLDQIRIRDHGTGTEHRIALPEASYAASLGQNPDYVTDRLRISYESMITPDTVYDYHVADRRLETLKVREIPSGYDANAYKTERLMAPARDGVQIPVSIVYPKGFEKATGAPVHMIGYGAYGYGYPPGFSSARLSLLDRGFAIAIAHVRGGDELGRGWHEAGKLKSRTNTFNDFVDAARYLIDSGWAEPGRISASGGSAGGELMGAIANQAPDLWGGLVLHVPFVDVLNTMLDTSLPLTPIEWPEWGNPIEDAEAFAYIHSYSPYDQIEAKVYPPMLVTAGLNDPRVTYWEPAKWTAKLRAVKTDDHLLMLKTNMGAGHGGKSGRFDSLYETAEEYTFILMALGGEG